MLQTHPTFVIIPLLVPFMAHQTRITLFLGHPLCFAAMALDFRHNQTLNITDEDNLEKVY